MNLDEVGYTQLYIYVYIYRAIGILYKAIVYKDRSFVKANQYTEM